MPGVRGTRCVGVCSPSAPVWMSANWMHVFLRSDSVPCDNRLNGLAPIGEPQASLSSPAHVAQDDPRIGCLVGRPTCSHPAGEQSQDIFEMCMGGGHGWPALAAPLTLHASHKLRIMCSAQPPGIEAHTAPPASPRSVLRRSSAQAPGVLPCHAHFWASTSVALGFCGRHSKPSHCTTTSLKLACSRREDC